MGASLRPNCTGAESHFGEREQQQPDDRDDQPLVREFAAKYCFDHGPLRLITYQGQTNLLSSPIIEKTS
jgi:hypothetical protein